MHLMTHQIRRVFGLLICIVMTSCSMDVGGGNAKFSRPIPLGPTQSLSGVLFCDKSARAAFYWDDGGFEIWDTVLGRRLGDRHKLPRPIDWCLSSSDQTLIVTADKLRPTGDSNGGGPSPKDFVPTVRIWDAKSGLLTHAVAIREAIGDHFELQFWSAQWLDGKRLAVVWLSREGLARAASGMKVFLIDVASGKLTSASRDFGMIGDRLIPSPDHRLAIAMADNFVRRDDKLSTRVGNVRNIFGGIRVIDLESLKVIASWYEPRDPTTSKGALFYATIAAWCTDSKAVITVDNNWRDGDHPAPRIHLWDALTGQLRQTFAGHTDYVLDVATSSDCKSLLSAGEDRVIRVWDIQSGKLRHALSGHNAGVNKVVILPGNRLAVSAAEETTAKVWDLTSGKLRFDLGGHDSAVRSLSVLSSTKVSTTTLLGTTTVWDCLTGKPISVRCKAPRFPMRMGVLELIEDQGQVEVRNVRDTEQHRR